MNLKSRIPEGFYKLFSSKYVDDYMAFLVELYKENRNTYSTLGLTEDECQNIINERVPYQRVEWRTEDTGEGPLLEMESVASVCLLRFIDWGWLKKEFDEVLNCYVVFFPEYSQLYIELFEKLLAEEKEQERESILAIYSYIFTYSSDQEKNIEILNSALSASQRLVQLLANMQEGMRSYFDDLSNQSGFRGIQEVLIREINNTDSKKYAILTTTDSFYRYKEAVKELIIDGLSENDQCKEELRKVYLNLPAGSLDRIRAENAFINCEKAIDLLYQIERQFDLIEKRYNMLINQKTIFASRAAARLRYVMQEGVMDEERTITLVNLLAKSKQRAAIFADFEKGLNLTMNYRVIKEQSLFSKREREKIEFNPEPLKPQVDIQEAQIDDFILKPLYTKKQLREFRKRNMVDGKFVVTEETVQSIDDLEKLIFVWQEATELNDGKQKVLLKEEIKTVQGFTFSRLVIEEE